MGTTCYAMVRGSTLRVTGLRPDGALPGTGPISAAVSRAVVKVTLDEVNDSQSSEVLRDEVDQPRINMPALDDTVGYMASVSFLKADPGMLDLMTTVSLAHDAAGDVVGFDAQTRLPAASFGLEVWSKLSGIVCADGQRWGYTLFPFLKGGYLSGFAFGDGVVSFVLKDAMTQRGSLWNVGPYDLEGPYERLLLPVSGNGSWRSGVTATPPPVDSCGTFAFEDLLDNGDAADPMPYPLAPAIVDGGSAASVGPDWIVDGGGA